MSTPTAIRKTPAVIATPRTKRALLARHHIVAPSLRVADAAAASVFGAARLRGPIARDVIAQTTGLSIATVNRQVTALLDAGVLRERADLAVSGAIGRPRVPVEVNHEPFLTLGIHVGARTAIIVATDLFGRTLDVVETPTPRGAQNSALAALAGSAEPVPESLAPSSTAVGRRDGRRCRRQRHRARRPRPARLDRRARWVPVLAETLGLPVSLASHVDAMAGAELLLGGRRVNAPAAANVPPATSLYVYARETVGYALSIGGRVHSPTSGPGTIAALPAQSEMLGGSGQLESTVSDEAVLTAARRLRIVPADGPSSTIGAVLRSARQGNQPAVDLLGERAQGARRVGSAAAGHAQPRRPRRRRAGVHRVPGGHGGGRGGVRQAVGARAARPAADLVRQPRPGSRRRGRVPGRPVRRSDRGDAAGGPRRDRLTPSDQGKVGAGPARCKYGLCA